MVDKKFDFYLKALPEIDEEILRNKGWTNFEISIYRILRKKKQEAASAGMDGGSDCERRDIGKFEG